MGAAEIPDVVAPMKKMLAEQTPAAERRAAVILNVATPTKKMLAEQTPVVERRAAEIPDVAAGTQPLPLVHVTADSPHDLHCNLNVDSDRLKFRRLPF